MAGTIILGSGMAGLGAGLATRAPVYESAFTPGGVCHSFYRTRDGAARDPLTDNVDDCFRFEPAGGHWLFGASDAALARFRPYSAFRSYVRSAAAFFSRDDRYVPFPIQYHLHCFDSGERARMLDEIEAADGDGAEADTFAQWLLTRFGPALCERFFLPFNARYTAGYLDALAPQDLYKSAIDLAQVRAGARGAIPDTGYNATFHYPERGLDRLVRGLASGCDVHFGHEVVRIDAAERRVTFADGTGESYVSMISTLPLDRMLRLCDVGVDVPPDPATAVLVVNIGALRGRRCPHFHWVYVPDACSGLHRVGFYSNVDADFVPRGCAGDKFVGIYAERSYRSGQTPDATGRAQAAAAIVAELQQWGFIEEALVVEPTVADPAYTWKWPHSRWADCASANLAARGIRQIGRYGAWKFQGMVASFEEGVNTSKPSDL
jgi:protoporphyrinogen oxidase